MSLRKDIDELLEAKVISKDAAESIELYYQSNSNNSQNRLITIFAVLGALLVGTGIILIIAHNWDDLSKFTKSVLAFIPIIIGQLLVLYSILKKSDSIVWRESSSVFLVLSIGTCIGLISQIYHIQGNFGEFMMTWCILSLPIVYISRSSVSSLLYLTGATIYAFSNLTFINGETEIAYPYFLLILGMLLHYWSILKDDSAAMTQYHHWFIVLSLSMAIGPVVAFKSSLSLVYVALFGLLYHIGSNSYFQELRPWANAYRIVGSLGSLIVLFVMSSRFTWNDFISREEVTLEEYWVPAILTLMTLVVFLRNGVNRLSLINKPVSLVFLIYPILFFGLKNFPEAATLIVNIIILAIGVRTIVLGSQLVRLRLLNWGLLIVAFQILIRFLDTDLSFVLRGLIFVLVGIGFFMSNYLLIQKKKSNES